MTDISSSQFKRLADSTWLIKIEVETSDDADYILEHLDTKNAVLSTELEELEC